MLMLEDLTNDSFENSVDDSIADPNFSPGESQSDSEDSNEGCEQKNIVFAHQKKKKSEQNESNKTNSSFIFRLYSLKMNLFFRNIKSQFKFKYNSHYCC